MAAAYNISVTDLTTQLTHLKNKKGLNLNMIQLNEYE